VVWEVQIYFSFHNRFCTFLGVKKNFEWLCKFGELNKSFFFSKPFCFMKPGMQRPIKSAHYRQGQLDSKCRKKDGAANSAFLQHTKRRRLALRNLCTKPTSWIERLCFMKRLFRTDDEIKL
jgi:hypothetical protein